MQSSRRFDNLIRIAQVATGVLFLVLALGFYLRWPLVSALWPWVGYYNGIAPLSYTFMSSLLAAFGVPLLWIGLSGEIRAAVPITIDVLVTLLGWGLFMAQSYSTETGNQRLLVGAIACLASLPVALLVIRASQKPVLRDPQPTPLIVRLSFGLFAVGLLIVGYGLLVRHPSIFPWQLSAEASIMYGWAFWGAAAYFLYGVLQPKWSLAAGQLLGFLAYDLVLIVPYISHFSAVRDDLRLSLTIYVIVLVYSGTVAAFYLFMNPRTRIWRGLQVAGAVVSTE